MQLGNPHAAGVPSIKLQSLTGLRFFAALLVVIHHTFRDLVEVPGVSEAVWIGTVGVSFFFALSGFVLMWAFGGADTKRNFYRRRFARVYPLHFLTLLLAVMFFLSTGKAFDAGQLLVAAGLLQAWIPDSNAYFGFNAPSWSLSGEALFYAAFPFLAPRLVRLGRQGLWKLLASVLGLALAIAVMVTLALGAGDGARFWVYIFPPFRILEFAAGCLLALLVKSGWRSRISLSKAALAAGVAYAVLVTTNRNGYAVGNGVEDALMLPFILLLIASAATADLSGDSRLLPHPWMVRLGEWSFSLYLTHWLFLELVVRLDPGSKTRPFSLQLIEGGAFVLAAVALSAAVFTWFEKPMEKRLRGSRSRPEEMRGEEKELAAVR